MRRHVQPFRRYSGYVPEQRAVVLIVLSVLLSAYAATQSKEAPEYTLPDTGRNQDFPRHEVTGRLNRNAVEIGYLFMLL